MPAASFIILHPQKLNCQHTAREGRLASKHGVAGAG
jgi:hypothetical protein